MTKEDLMQIKQLLDEQKQEIIKESTTNTNVLIESMIKPQFDLLAEGLADIQEKLTPRSRVDELEEEVKFMKIMFRQMAEDIAELKKAQ